MGNDFLKHNASFLRSFLLFALLFTTVRGATNKYIVQFEENGTEEDEKIFQKFYSGLAEIGVEAKPGLEIPSTIFTATSFEVTNDKDPYLALKLPNVLQMWEVGEADVPTPLVDESGEKAIKKGKAWNSFANTGVEKLHGKGITGQGVVIAILDSGIDYNHPALGGGIGPDKKIEFGYRFSERGTPKRSDKGSMDCNGHGTHVAGIIAGKDLKHDFLGVAFDAKLRSYKVTDCDSNKVTDDVLISAMNLAYKEGADIIQSSFSHPVGWSQSALAAAVSKIVAQGVFVSIAGGNDGSEGPFYGASGACGEHVMSVGSIDNDQYYTWTALVEAESEKFEIPFNHLTKDKSKFLPKMPVYAISLDPDALDTACSPLDPSVPDLARYSVLVRRGRCSIEDQLAHLAKRGAKTVLFYNNDEPYSFPQPSTSYGVRYAMTTADSGIWIIKRLGNGKPVHLTLLTKAHPLGPVPNSFNPGKMSVFSSWGPTYDFKIKPEISAPGGHIFSTYPLEKGAYATMSGTSMASPYIAGIAALYISKQKKLGNSKGPSNRAILLKNKIMASGAAIPWFDGKAVDTDVNAPVSQAGAGYVDAWKVVNYVTSISPAKIELGPTNQFRSTQTIKVTNEGDKPIHYNIVHVPDPGVCTSKPGGVAWSFPPQLAPSITAKVSFDPNGFDVAPGQTYSLDLQFEHPASGPEDCMFPTYSGRLELSGTSDNYREDLVIPYLGVAGDSSKVSVLSPQSKFYYKQPGSKERFDVEGEIFTLDGDDRPGFFMNLLLGAREYKFELVTPDWKPNDWNYRPQYGYPPYMGQVFPNRRLQPRGSRELVLEDEILIDALSRDKRCIPDGQYMLLFSALKLSGDPFKRDSWDVELSPVFGVESIDGCDEREWRRVTWR